MIHKKLAESVSGSVMVVINGIKMCHVSCS